MLIIFEVSVYEPHLCTLPWTIVEEGKVVVKARGVHLAAWEGCHRLTKGHAAPLPDRTSLHAFVARELAATQWDGH